MTNSRPVAPVAPRGEDPTREGQASRSLRPIAAGAAESAYASRRRRHAKSGTKSEAPGSVGIVMALVATMVVTLLFAPVGAEPAAAQDASSLQTRVQILHADPNSDEFEVFIDGEEVLDEFGYGELSDWIDFTPGAVYVTITEDRAGFNYIVFDAVYPAPAGHDYSMVITEALVYADAFDTSPIPDGGARVRIVQGAVALPPVNVAADGTDVAFATALAYPRTSDYAVVPAGTYDFEVTLADTGEVALTAPGMVLEGNTTYDLVIMGQPGDENHPLELRPISAAAMAQATPVP